MVRRIILSIICVCLISGIFIVKVHSQIPSSAAVETLRYYFDLLLSNNLESARGLWTQEINERSSRFGIEFEGIPLKLDCSSPVVRNLSVMRDYLYQPARSVEKLPGDSFYTLEFSAVVNGDNVTHLYYAYYDGAYFWLTYPQDYYARSWPVMESKYFRIHYDPDVKAFLHPLTLEAADKFVEDIADSLNLTSADMKNLADKKIEYFYCRSDSTVNKITGFKVKGMLDLATNDIISAFFPHFHEITHLLVNIKLHKIPLYTQPILREGIAVYYGGRWGKAPATLYYLGAFLDKEKIVEVDSIITMNRFEQQATADMAYPEAGLFTAFLIDRLGTDKYFDLYRTLSGQYDSLYMMKAPRIKKILYETIGESSWDDLKQSFSDFAQTLTTDKAPFGPGEDIGRSSKVVKTDKLAIKENHDWLAVRITGNGADFPTGNILFGKDDKLTDQHSLLFDEQYSGAQEFPGYRYGLRFDGNEAGLYDYVTNQLVAKYIWGITPSDKYRNEGSKTVSFKYRKDLSDGVIPREGEYQLLTN